MNYLEFNVLTSVYIENSDEANSFYSLETVFSIKDRFIKRISFLDFRKRLSSSISKNLEKLGRVL